MRRLSASFSSRAAVAIALTASNSSRLTRSSPPTHSRGALLHRAWASRVMPAMRAGGAVHHLDEIVEQTVLGLHRAVLLWLSQSTISVLAGAGASLAGIGIERRI